MKKATIEELAYIIKQAKENGQPKPIFFLGAGASKTGNIPLARDIVKDILEKYVDSPKIKKLTEKEQTYAKLMECLLPYERDKLLKGYIDEAKINVTHLYLAQLLKNDFVDYILTVNFDNLMLRALALFNEFPSTYDMAILKDLTTTTFKEQSVVYLHGQHHGLWLLNTKEEMDKVNATVPRIFDSIKNKRPWIFIGYSGDDPIFKHIENLGRFDNGLYWITYNNYNPNDKVKEFLNTPNTNAFIIKGFDSDSFMLKLNNELGITQPDIVNKPFTSLNEMLNNIVDIDDEEHFKGVKERLEISKNQVKEAVQQFEMGKVEPTEKIKKTSEIDLLKKEIIDLIINKKYLKENIEIIEAKAKRLNSKNINDLLASLYSSWGTDLGNLAEEEEPEEAEKLYTQAFEKYQKAIEIKPNNHQAFTNWGTDLGNLAEEKEPEEAEKLYIQAFEKFQKAIEVKPDDHQAFFNWGIDLGNLAKGKEPEEAEKLYTQAFEKFQKAIEIKPGYHKALNNWGTSLLYFSKIKEGEEKKELFNQSVDKLQKAVELGGKCYNLACFYAIKSDKDNALHYLDESLKKKEITTIFVKEDEDWKEYLKDKDFNKLIEKYIV